MLHWYVHSLMKAIPQLRFNLTTKIDYSAWTPLMLYWSPTSGFQICSRACFHGNGGFLKDFYGGVAILPRNVCERWCVSSLLCVGILGALLERGVCIAQTKWSSTRCLGFPHACLAQESHTWAPCKCLCPV